MRRTQKGSPMENQERRDILDKARAFFSTSIAESHAKNTEKCSRLSEFNVNPFVIHYLAYYAFGDDSAESLAKALIYPRVLGTSISTTFGNSIQAFCHEVLGGYASVVAGMDIEFMDAFDGKKKYCQLKAGPQTINKDDVATIEGHFQTLKNLARTNRLENFNPMTDCVVGVLYGTHGQISANYKVIERDYPVYAGSEFWGHLTGDDGFYKDLIDAFASCAKDYRDTNVLNETIARLAEDIRNNPSILACEDKVDYAFMTLGLGDNT